MKNYDSLLKRVRKVVKDKQQLASAPSIMLINDGDDLPDTNGLVIVSWVDELEEIAAQDTLTAILRNFMHNWLTYYQFR